MRNMHFHRDPSQPIPNLVDFNFESTHIRIDDLEREINQELAIDPQTILKAQNSNNQANYVRGLSIERKENPRKYSPSRKIGAPLQIKDLKDKLLFINQSLTNYGYQNLPDNYYLSSEMRPEGILTTLELILKLLRDKQSNVEYRKRNSDKYAKMKSDLKNSRNKVERLEGVIKDLNKKIGSVENQLSMSRSQLKNTKVKINSTKTAKKQLDSKKTFSKKLFEHDLRKKEKEIARLKELMKKSSLMHKDKIESFTKMSRFEVNNFYDGMEKEFNILDSKKGGVLKKMSDENDSMRSTFIHLYDEILGLARKAQGRNDLMTPLNENMMNKPFHYIAKDVEMSFLYLINEIGRKVKVR